jgi:hypothetical protein
MFEVLLDALMLLLLNSLFDRYQQAQGTPDSSDVMM